jgi:hypothetical protein
MRDGRKKNGRLPAPLAPALATHPSHPAGLGTLFFLGAYDSETRTLLRARLGRMKLKAADGNFKGDQIQIRYK